MHDKMAYTIDETSEYTGIGRNTIRRLIEWKKLPVLKVGRKLLIRKDTIEAFMQINEGRDLRDKDAVMEIRILPDTPAHLSRLHESEAS